MSGIAGIIHFDGKPVEPGLIEKMTSAMAHRGPDGINHWVKGSVALGQCMLRTTPESLEEHQPLTNEDESLVLVMDGRVDNWEELRRELLGRGAVLRTRADAELVLRAYEQWRDESPRRLLGDFAFVIWDVRRQRLFCARDHLGVKPFYYFRGSEFLAFASDEEALLGLPGVLNEPNELRIAYYLVLRYEGFDSHASWLRNIISLGPGQSMKVRPGGQEAVDTYWQLEPLPESRFGSDSECQEAFRSVLKESIRCRMRTLGHPSLMLSGGIDSASIAGAARDLLREFNSLELHTFSVISADAAHCSETRNIQKIIREHERQSRLIPLPGFCDLVTLQDLKDAAWGHAHPIGNTILLPAMMYLAAARSSNRIMYDGLDGDLVTYTPFREPIHHVSTLLRSGAWREAWSEARLATSNNTYFQQESPLTMISKGAWDAFVPDYAKRFKRSVSSVLVGGALRKSIVNRDFATRLHLSERLSDWRSDARARMQRGVQHEHIHWLTQPGIPCTMAGFDPVAARYSVEPRHPWSDLRLIEFYLRLPMRQKTRDGWTKWLLRKSVSPWLDSDVRWHRGKEHLGWRLVRELLNQSRDEILDTLRNSKGVLAQYVEPRLWRSLVVRYSASPTDADLDNLHAAMTLVLWLHRVTTLRSPTAAVFPSVLDMTGCTPVETQYAGDLK